MDGTDHGISSKSSTRTGRPADRAEDMDPAGSAQRLGIPFSMHSDASVTPVDPLFRMWTATARKTMSGRVLGENERITVPQALHAVTLGAAYLLGQDDKRVRSKQASSPISPCLTAIRSTSPRPTSSETSRCSAPSWAAKPSRLVPCGLGESSVAPELFDLCRGQAGDVLSGKVFNADFGRLRLGVLELRLRDPLNRWGVGLALYRGPAW